MHQASCLARQQPAPDTNTAPSYCVQRTGICPRRYRVLPVIRSPALIHFAQFAWNLEPEGMLACIAESPNRHFYLLRVPSRCAWWLVLTIQTLSPKAQQFRAAQFRVSSVTGAPPARSGKETPCEFVPLPPTP